MSKFRNVLKVAVGLTLVVLIHACGGGDDTEELRRQLSDLQTQVSEPTATPRPTSTAKPAATPDLAGLCDAVEEYLTQRGEAVVRRNEIGESHQYIDDVTAAERDEIEALFKQAGEIFLPLPPAGAPSNAHQLRDLVRDLRATDQRMLNALGRADADAYNAELPTANGLLGEVRAYWVDVCQ